MDWTLLAAVVAAIVGTLGVWQTYLARREGVNPRLDITEVALGGSEGAYVLQAIIRNSGRDTARNVVPVMRLGRFRDLVPRTPSVAIPGGMPFSLQFPLTDEQAETCAPTVPPLIVETRFDVRGKRRSRDLDWK